jgi:hypothetical protein
MLRLTLNLGRAMAALGQLRRVLRPGMICLLLAATCPGAALAEAPDSDTTALRPPSDAPADEKGDVASERDANADGDVSLHPTAAELETIILRTLGAPDLQALVVAAAGGAVLEPDARVRELGAELDLRPEALARIFEMLGRQDVPPAQLAKVLAEIVARQKSLLERVRLLEASEPRAAELRDALAAAIETAEYDRVDALLVEAEAIEFEAMRQLLAALDQRILNAAAIYPDAGGFAGAMLGHKGRAGFGGLLQLIPPGRFCEWHSGHGLCERWAADSERARASVCDRLPNHPLCDDDRFCHKRPDHPLCNEDPPPSPS